jgi:hypothetical protein
MLASPRAQQGPDANGNPADQPQPKRRDAQKEMRPMIDLDPNKYLPVMTVRAIGPESGLPHEIGPVKGETVRFSQSKETRDREMLGEGE